MESYPDFGVAFPIVPQMQPEGVISSVWQCVLADRGVTCCPFPCSPCQRALCPQRCHGPWFLCLSPPGGAGCPLIFPGQQWFQEGLLLPDDCSDKCSNCLRCQECCHPVHFQPECLCWCAGLVKDWDQAVWHSRRQEHGFQVERETPFCASQNPGRD